MASILVALALVTLGAGPGAAQPTPEPPQGSAPVMVSTFAEVMIDPFLVRNVAVDVTATTVTEARDRGMTQARVSAFRRLVERMTPRENWAAITTPETSKIIDMVLEFSVANERSSAVRYLADLMVRFDPAAIRSFLRSQNVPFAETASRPLIVVPLYQDGTVVQLWQDGNPWRDAWAASLPHDGLVPFVLPLGDLQDSALLSTEQALAKDRDALMKVAAKYGAAGAVVAHATHAGDNLKIAVSEIRALGDQGNDQFNATVAGEGKLRADAFAAAAVDAMRPVEDRWKKRNTLRFGAGGKMTALVPVSSLQEWLSVRARLARIPVIEKVDLEAMSKALIQASITYAGDETQLQFAMSQSELELTKDGDMWLLHNLPQRAASSP